VNYLSVHHSSSFHTNFTSIHLLPHLNLQPQRRSVPEQIGRLLINRKPIIHDLEIKSPHKPRNNQLHLRIRQALANAILGPDAKGLEDLLVVGEGGRGAVRVVGW
jgi:hypothetical protein